MLITPKELNDWLKENSKLLTDYKGSKQLKLQILDGSKGLYFVVDDFVPKEKASTSKKAVKTSNANSKEITISKELQKKILEKLKADSDPDFCLCSGMRWWEFNRIVGFVASKY